MIPVSVHSPPQCGHRSGTATISSTGAGIGHQQKSQVRSGEQKVSLTPID